MEETTKELNLETSDPKLKELVERFNQLAKDYIEAGYSIQPFTEQGIRIIKIPEKTGGILKGFRGYKK